MEKEVADQMVSHVRHGVPAETPPSHRPLVLARTLEGTTPLMAAAGHPSPCCVEAVSDISLANNVIGNVCACSTAKHGANADLPDQSIADI